MKNPKLFTLRDGTRVVLDQDSITHVATDADPAYVQLYTGDGGYAVVGKLEDFLPAAQAPTAPKPHGEEIGYRDVYLKAKERLDAKNAALGELSARLPHDVVSIEALRRRIADILGI